MAKFDAAMNAFVGAHLWSSCGLTIAKTLGILGLILLLK